MTLDPLFIRFIGWLKKHRSRQHLTKCLKKWRKEGLTEEKLEAFIETFGNGHIWKYRKPSGGEEIVEILDLDWADSILIEYEEEIPGHNVKRGHHCQQVKWKK